MTGLDAAAAAPGLESLGYRQELKRALSGLDLLVYGLVFIVPIAPLFNFGFVFNASKGMVPLVYLVGLVAMLFTAVSYQTMARTFPSAGSVYAYAGRGIAPALGFLAGWVMLLDYLLLPSLVYVSCALSLAQVMPGVPKPVWVLVLLGFNTLINLRGIQLTAQVNKLLLLAQLLLLAVFAVLGVMALQRGVAGAHLSLTPLWNPASVTPALVFGALSLAAVSFLGFDAISTLAEEAKGGAHAVGRATVLSLVVVAALFVGQTYLASLFMLGQTSFALGDATATAHLHIAELVGGQPFRWAMAGFAVVISGIPGALAAQAATGRLIYSMARDGRLPRVLARIDPHHNVPQRALLLVSAVTLVLALAMLDHLDLLFSLVSFGALTGFLMVHVSVLVHHAWRGRSRRWLTHMASPVIGFAIIGYVLLNLDPLAKIVGAVWLAVGLAGLAAIKLRGGALPVDGPPPG